MTNENSSINVDIKLSGEYRLEVFGADGELKTDTGFFKNILTNGFFDGFVGGSSSSGNFFSYCGVGSGTAAATAADTTITQVGSRQGTTSDLTFTESSRVITMARKFQFAASAIIGTIAEVGIFTTSTAGTLTSRTRIKDTGGTPTTITLISGDTLYVTYRLTATAPTSDVSSTCSISGVTYNYVLRPALLTNALNGNGNFWAIVTNTQANLGLGSAYARASQTLGAYTSVPTGTSFATSTVALSTYTSGTFTRTFTYSFSVSQGNTGSGIGSIVFSGLSESGGWQCSFANASGGATIPKDATKTFTIPLVLTFSR